MTVARPARPRSTIARTGEGLQITIPARRDWFTLAFLGVWLAGWVVGEVGALTALIMAPAPPAPPLDFLGLWLLFWTFAGATALMTWLWNLAGKEVATFKMGALDLRQGPGPLARRRTFPLREVHDLRISHARTRQAPFSDVLTTGNGSPGVLAFEYGSRTYRFGSNLNQEEAEWLLSAIR